MEREIRVVYVDHCARLSGGELALERLIGAFNDVRAHVILGEHGPLEGRLRKAGASVEVLALGDELANVSRDEVKPGRLELHRVADAWRAVATLRRRLDQLRPDLVHTNSLKAAIYGGLAGRLAGIPVVWHIRDRIADDYLPKPAVVAIGALSLVLPSVIICNSEETRRTLGRDGRSQVIPSPVVYDVTLARPDRGGTSGPFTAAIVGRLAPWKGQDVFLDAFASAFPDGDEQAVIIGSALFGEDDWADHLRDRVVDLGLVDRVTFTGFVDDVPGALVGVDVLVHASVIPEPFGQVVVEGMANGLAVVAAAAGGPLEILTDEVDGLLSPPGDVAQLAERLRRLRDSPALCRELGARARETAAQFAPERVAAQVRAVYADLLR